MIPGMPTPSSFTEVDQNYFKFPYLRVVPIPSIPEIKKEKPKWLRDAEILEAQKFYKEKKLGANIDLFA